MRPIANAGTLVSSLAGRGANALNGIAFVVSPDPKRDDVLRVEAMKDARHKAQVYVEALGLRLGRVLTVTPQDQGTNAPRTFNAAPSRAAVPLAAGTRNQEAQVSVSFEVLQ